MHYNRDVDGGLDGLPTDLHESFMAGRVPDWLDTAGRGDPDPETYLADARATGPPVVARLGVTEAAPDPLLERLRGWEPTPSFKAELAANPGIFFRGFMVIVTFTDDGGIAGERLVAAFQD